MTTFSLIVMSIYSAFFGAWAWQMLIEWKERKQGPNEFEAVGKLVFVVAKKVCDRRMFIGAPEEGQTVTITESILLTLKNEKPIQLNVVAKVEA